jgi:hypothetical protein
LNSLVLMSIWKTPSLHKPSYILIANLALTDLIVGAIVEPLMAITNIAALEKWTSIFCRTWIFGRAVGYWMGAMSINTLVAISVDRLLAIRLMRRYQSVVTMKRVMTTLVMCWASTCCFLFLIKSYIAKVTIILSVYLFILLGTLTVCYSMSYHRLRKLSSPVTPNTTVETGSTAINTAPLPCTTFPVSKYKRPLNTMLLVFLTIMLFYFPYFCAIVTTSAIYKVVPNASESRFRILTYKFVTVGELIVFVNSTMNPILYLWRIKDIREGVKITICRMLGRKTSK